MKVEFFLFRFRGASNSLSNPNAQANIKIGQFANDVLSPESGPRGLQRRLTGLGRFRLSKSCQPVSYGPTPTAVLVVRAGSCAPVYSDRMQAVHMRDSEGCGSRVISSVSDVFLHLAPLPSAAPNNSATAAVLSHKAYAALRNICCRACRRRSTAPMIQSPTPTSLHLKQPAGHAARWTGGVGTCHSGARATGAD